MSGTTERQDPTTDAGHLRDRPSDADERPGHSSVGFVELLGGTLLVVFGVLSATAAGRFSLPGLPVVSAPFLILPFGCLAIGSVARARGLQRRSPVWASAWLQAGGFVLVFGNLLLLSSFLVGIPVRNIFIWGFALGCVLVVLASVSAGTMTLSHDVAGIRTGLLLVGWPILAALTLVAFMLLGVGSVVAASTIPLGVTWVVLAVPRLRLQ